MADTKISDLTAQTAAIATTDMFPMVDADDTSMAASGTTKKATNPILPLMHLSLWNLGVR